MKIKILKDSHKDNPSTYSIEELVGKTIEAEHIDDDGWALVKDEDGYYTDIAPDEYEFVKYENFRKDVSK